MSEPRGAYPKPSRIAFVPVNYRCAIVGHADAAEALRLAALVIASTAVQPMDVTVHFEKSGSTWEVHIYYPTLAAEVKADVTYVRAEEAA
jgi:hypothetical protein